ncbi:hypothetical protein MBLNU459_g7808t1 [Dothideomycetes sp. NU459]
MVDSSFPLPSWKSGRKWRSRTLSPAVVDRLQNFSDAASLQTRPTAQQQKLPSTHSTSLAKLTELAKLCVCKAKHGYQSTEIGRRWADEVEKTIGTASEETEEHSWEQGLSATTVSYDTQDEASATADSTDETLDHATQSQVNQPSGEITILMSTLKELEKEVDTLLRANSVLKKQNYDLRRSLLDVKAKGEAVRLERGNAISNKMTQGLSESHDRKRDSKSKSNSITNGKRNTGED